jgi:secreted trypsin-like serine protease
MTLLLSVNDDIIVSLLNIIMSRGSLRLQGDRGGPLVQVSEVDGKASLVGLMSWMAACESPGFPAVFTKIPYYAPWIRRQVADIENHAS